MLLNLTDCMLGECTHFFNGLAFCTLDKSNHVFRCAHLDERKVWYECHLHSKCCLSTSHRAYNQQTTHNQSQAHWYICILTTVWKRSCPTFSSTNKQTFFFSSANSRMCTANDIWGDLPRISLVVSGGLLAIHFLIYFLFVLRLSLLLVIHSCSICKCNL